MSKFTVANAALNLLGKKILIVGGTQGIGKATAIEFSKLGASVMILGRSLEKGQQVLGEMSSNKQNPQFFEFDQLDVLNISNVKKFCSRLLDHSEFQQGLDGLVLCAGGLNYGARRVTEEGFEMTFAQNYLSRFALIQGLLPLLSKNGGRVVNCLGANQGSQIYLDDFQLEKPSYLPFFIRAADQYGAMTDAVTKELAKLHGKDINGPMFFHLFPDDSLKTQEALISPTVLKHSQLDNTPFHDKQKAFYNTCFAIRKIIKEKLYRVQSTNLEQYFLKKFNVSRAQVYRLMDCASVLECLYGLYPLPHKYRICKELKQKAGVGKECRQLWSDVLKHGTFEDQIDQFNYDALPKLVEKPRKKSIGQDSDPGDGDDTLSDIPSKRRTSEPIFRNVKPKSDFRHFPNNEPLSWYRSDANNSNPQKPMNTDSNAKGMHTLPGISSFKIQPSIIKRTFQYPTNSDLDNSSKRSSPSMPLSYVPEQPKNSNVKESSYQTGETQPQEQSKKLDPIQSLSSQPETSQFVFCQDIKEVRTDDATNPIPYILSPPRSVNQCVCISSELDYKSIVNISSPHPCSHCQNSRPENDNEKSVEVDYETHVQELQEIEKQFLICQEAMVSLAQKGYQLTPFVDGQWVNVPITEWRIVPNEELVNQNITKPSSTLKPDQMLYSKISSSSPLTPDTRTRRAFSADAIRPLKSFNTSPESYRDRHSSLTSSSSFDHLLLAASAAGQWTEPS
ncbi:hypothetical protein HDV02_005458 [Globomyces sp. JEL0801]|nr:hypothetical protein HDV02_005458 [Globomyces sp. JEL0801]